MPFIYQTNYTMQEIEASLLARGRAGRVGLDIFPEAPKNAAQVRWTQADNHYGLQQMRGLNGQPSHVKRTGRKQYVYEPGVYGEFELIDETELVTRAGSAPIDSTPIDVSDLVAEADSQLIGREYDRKEWLAWNALRGSITVTLGGENGIQRAYTDTYAVQTYTAPVPWATSATATPILNFQSVQQLQVGSSVNFGAGATAYMNQVTANRLLNNANTADLAGRRNQFGATINNIEGVASYWGAQNLPKIVVYDAGYYPTIGGTTAAQFTKFIQDGEVFVVGVRPGNARVGEMQMTRNAMNPNLAPGSYRFIKDYANGVNAPKEVPPRIEIHRGWNGGPVVFFASAIVRMLV